MRFFTVVLWCLLLLVTVSGLRAQSVPDTLWQKVYSGQDWDYVNTAVQTADGGYLLACATGVKSRATRHGRGGSDIWMVRTDTSGRILWQKNYGGSRDDRVVTVVRGTGGGYVFAGMTQSADGDIPNGKYHGKGDAWVVKIDDTGKILWQQVLGGSAFDCANSVIVTPDSGYLMTGYTASKNGDLSSNAGKTDVWMVKMDKEGKPAWSKTCGGAGDDLGSRAINVAAGGYLVLCHTTSSGVSVSGYHGGGVPWLVRVNTSGELMWEKTLGGPGSDFATALSPTPDGGYMICGTSRSPDVAGHKDNGNRDVWVVKTDRDGAEQWQKTYDAARGAIVRTAHALPDGDFLFTGNGGSINAGNNDSTTWHTDGEVFCVSATGDLRWRRAFGAGYNDSCNFSLVTDDGGLLCVGSCYAVGATEPRQRSGWMFKTTPVFDAGILTGGLKKYGNAIKVFPSPTQGPVNIVLPDELAGCGISVFDMNGKKLGVAISGSGTHHMVSLSGNAPGAYILKLNTEEGSGTYRIELR